MIADEIAICQACEIKNPQCDLKDDGCGLAEFLGLVIKNATPAQKNVIKNRRWRRNNPEAAKELARKAHAHRDKEKKAAAERERYRQKHGDVRPYNRLRVNAVLNKFSAIRDTSHEERSTPATAVIN